MTVVLAFLLMLLLVGAMAIGVIFGRKPITGSCGGMKALGLNMECEVCGGDPERCDSSKNMDVAQLSYRAENTSGDDRVQGTPD